VRTDLPALISYLAGKRAEWEASDAEVIVGRTVGRLGGFDSGYKERDSAVMCGNPFVGASMEIMARPWWKKLLGPSDAVAENELSLHFDLDRLESEFARQHDPVNRAARERVLAWWEKSGKAPHIARWAPQLRPNPRAYLREHPVEAKITWTGPIRYERGGFVRVVPVRIGAGASAGLYRGAEMEMPNFNYGTTVTLTAVTADTSEGEARDYELFIPLDLQRIPVPGKRVMSRSIFNDEWQEE
jgi:hypothetical protein